MTITTNNQPRDLLYLSDFSSKDQEIIRQDYNWMDEDDLECNFGFFKYKNHIYHLQDFMRTETEGWDGGKAESWSCGVLIKLSEDCERVTCGWWSI